MALALVDLLEESDGSLDPRARLRRAADAVCPVVLAAEQTIPVLPALAPLLPEGSLRRGTTVSVGSSPGAGATSLTLALAAGAVAVGSWVAIVGHRSIGLSSAAELGLPLERLVSIRSPAPGDWGAVVAALIGAFDLVLVAPGHRVKPADARRLAARCRERGSVMIRTDVGRHRWPEAADISLSVVEGSWQGLGVGHGHLVSRRVVIEATGRREAARVRRHELLLPGPDGVPAPLPSPESIPVVTSDGAAPTAADGGPAAAAFAGADVDALVEVSDGSWQAAG